MEKSLITKETVHHLAQLARISLTEKEQEKMVGELQNILEHIAQLQNADTTDVIPMTGGTQLKNIFREDSERKNTLRGKGQDALPETTNDFLKIPPVFE